MDGPPQKATNAFPSGSMEFDFEKLDRKPLRRSRTIGLASTSWTHRQVEDNIHDKRFRVADLDIDEERINSSLDCHRRFEVKEGYEMKDLPKFNDLTRYDVQEEQEMDLWKFEVSRLATAVKSPNPPSLEGPAEWYGSADSDGYNRLHVMAATIKYALDVCTHDNELVLLEHEAPLANKELFVSSHRSLLRNFDPAEGIILFDRKIKLAQYNDEAYHGLVNYLTAILARLLLRTVKGKFWVDNCLSTIAKFAAKLKVLGNDIPQAVSRTIEAHKDVQMRMEELARTQTGRQLLPTPAGKEPAQESCEGSNWSALDIGQLGSSGVRYFIVMDVFDRGISHLLSNCVADLKWDEEVEQTADMFETSAIIYDAGFRRIRTQLCQERDGSIGVAAERNVIHCAGVAFDVCREVWTKQPSVKKPTGKYTTLDWNWTGLTDSEDLEASSPGSRSWATMQDVIAAFVPYSMFCGRFPTNLSQFARQIIQISDTTNPVQFYAQQNCLAAARIRTSQYESSRSKTTISSSSQTQNVYDTTMALEGALAGVQGDPNSSSAKELRRRHQAQKEKFRNAMNEVEKWVMDENSIIITSLWFSWVVLVAVGVLVAGGVALVAVQDRIDGVDPSNLTVLIWTAAGVLMIYFKSMRVENWPWRDFLRGRVVCRSVSEVEAVTKIDPQVLLAILMRFEPRIFLGKCGPFRNIFDRKAEGSFSIDVPPTTKTAVAGGHVFIRVDSTHGPALVGLEARNREIYSSIDYQDFRKRGTGYICRDLVDAGQYRIPLATEDGPEGKGGGSDLTKSLPLYPICTNELSWHRVQGVFVEEALFS